MALNAYLRLVGQTQGAIQGSVTQKGREASIMVIAFAHDIVSPRDAASGLPTGKRVHHPFVITKEVDRASPMIYGALVNNENLTSWELSLFRPQITAATGTGQEVHSFTVRLTNANVASVRMRMWNNKNPELARFAEHEEIAFTYQKVEWTWVKGGITAMDDWESPVV
jgi:type VI secretion system secreted protein Hcp